MKHNIPFISLLRLPLLLLLLMQCIHSIGQQNGPLVVDDAAGQYPESFPFDKPFDVKYIPKKKVATRYVGLFGVSREGCLADYRSKRTIIRDAKAGTTFKSAVRQQAMWESLFRNTSLSPKQLRDTFPKVLDSFFQDTSLSTKQLMDTFPKVLDNLFQDTSLSRRQLRDVFPETLDRLFNDSSLNRRQLRDTFYKVWDNVPRNKVQLQQIMRQVLHTIESTTLYDDFSNTDSNSVKFTVPPLRPNHQYMLLFLTHKRVEGIQEVVDALAIDSVALAKQRYKAIVDATRLPLSPRNGTGCSEAMNYEIGPFGDFKQFFNDSLRPVVNSIKHLQDSLKKVAVRALALNKIDIDPHAIDANIRQAVVAYSEQCLHCEDTIWQSEVVGKNTDIITPLLRLEQINDTSLSYGLRDIYSNETIDDAEIATDKRLQHLQTTATALVQLQRVMDYYHAKYRFDSRSYRAFRGEIERAVGLLSQNIILVMKQQKVVSILEKSISALKQRSDNLLQNCDELIQPTAKIDASTFTYNFDTRTGFLIKPDFGFLYYHSLSSKSSFQGFAPYLGFHINFRPLDTDIPFGTIRNEGVWGHLSFNAGALLGSFAEQGLRDGLIGNTAVFTGLGWAFTEWLRLTSGAVWYRKEEASPLKNHKTTAAVPYISLSFDLRLRGIYEAFVNIFPK